MARPLLLLIVCASAACASAPRASVLMAVPALGRSSTPPSTASDKSPSATAALYRQRWQDHEHIRFEYQRGDWYLRHDKLSQAASSFRKVIATSPRSDEAAHAARSLLDIQSRTATLSPEVLASEIKALLANAALLEGRDSLRATIEGFRAASMGEIDRAFAGAMRPSASALILMKDVSPPR